MVEKKSTGQGKGRSTARAKNRAKKVEGLKPGSEIQQAVEQVKPQEINWDVIGFSSAAVTLAGAALLFMLGWAYEVNWYGYFGVSMSQINSQPQNIIIQSIPSIATLLPVLLSSVIIVIFTDFLVQILPVPSNTHDKLNNKLPTRPRPFKLTRLEVLDWGRILLITEVALLTLFYFNWQGAQKLYRGLNGSNEIYYLEFFKNIIVGALLVLLVLSILISVGAFISKKIVKESRSFHLAIKTPQWFLVFLLLIFSIVFTSISSSAVYAINDAAHGSRGSGGWSMQPILLFTSKSKILGGLINQTCIDVICQSGPYGLIGENDTSFILTTWKKDGADYFVYHPGLYIIPKNESTYLVPFTVSSVPLSTPQPSLTPSPPHTALSTIKQTVRPTITSTPTPGASQP